MLKVSADTATARAPAMTKDTASNSGNIIEIRTASAVAIKTLFDALKEILLRCNLAIGPEGIHMCAVDPTKSAVMQFDLQAESFDVYQVRRSVNVGINVLKFQKLITKTLTSNDVLTLTISEDDPNTLCVTVDRSGKRSRTIYRLATTDVEVQSHPIDFSMYTTSVMMPSADMQRLIRDLNNMTDRVDISIVGQESVSFSGHGDKVSRETVISHRDNPEVTIINEPDRMLAGSFDISFLNIFARCTNLDPAVEIFMHRDLPLMIQYACFLGKVRFLLTEVVP